MTKINSNGYVWNVIFTSAEFEKTCFSHWHLMTVQRSGIEFQSPYKNRKQRAFVSIFFIVKNDTVEKDIKTLYICKRKTFSYVIHWTMIDTFILKRYIVSKHF